MQKHKNKSHHNTKHSSEQVEHHVSQEYYEYRETGWQKSFQKLLLNIANLLKHQPKSVAGVFAVLVMFTAVTASVIVPQLSGAQPINEKDAMAVSKCGYVSFIGVEPSVGAQQHWANYYRANNYDSKKLGKTLLESKSGQFTAYTTSFDSFIRRMYSACLKRTAPAADIKTWTTSHLKGVSREDIFNFIVQLGDDKEKLASLAKLAAKETRCAQYTKGGSVVPLCKPASSGTHSDVVTQTVSGTNIVVNKAWHSRVNSVVSKARSAGYNLQGYQDPRVPYPAGSYRSDAAQAWLKSRGYPVARGVSMHQWGLAIDFQCNGTPLNRHASCLRWMKNNAPAYGVYMLSSEPWHWSNNGH